MDVLTDFGMDVLVGSAMGALTGLGIDVLTGFGMNVFTGFRLDVFTGCGMDVLTNFLTIFLSLLEAGPLTCLSSILLCFVITFGSGNVICLPPAAVTGVSGVVVVVEVVLAFSVDKLFDNTVLFCNAAAIGRLVSITVGDVCFFIIFEPNRPAVGVL